MAYTPDLVDVPETSVAALAGVELWIVDALWYRPHPSHFHLDLTLQWIDRIKPKRAILTHLHSDLDYEKLRAMLPANVMPAYDGLRVEFDGETG
jgi:phosphoribosyl 1,2-cyclic phosphate phosphodiesterase